VTTSAAPATSGAFERFAASRAATWTLLAVVAVVFAPTLAGEFVFDDHRFIETNRAVANPESWSKFFTDATTADPSFSQGIVRPMRTFEFAFDHALFGPSPAGFHFHSLLWHAASAALLLFVLRRLVGDARAAFAGALLWAVHPVQVESVGWISSRGDVATGACCLLAILCALRTAGRDLDFFISLAAAAVATLYKETAVALPIVIAVLVWTRRSRAPIWPYLVVVGTYLVYRHRVQPRGDMGVSFVLGGSALGTFATMIRAFGWYLVEPLLPAQSLDWYLTPSTTFADVAVFGWLLVHAALATSAVALRNRAPRWTLCVACFYAFLLPVANWPFFTGIPTAERFLYLPLVGVALALAAGIARAPRAILPAAFAAAAALGAASMARAGLWHDDASMRDAVLADHESPRFRELAAEAVQHEALAAHELASSMPDGPRRDEAETRAHKLFEDALDGAHRAIDEVLAFETASRSDSITALFAESNASNVCHFLGREPEALFHAEEAIRIQGAAFAEPHYNRAGPLLALGFAPQAIASMRRARELGFSGRSAKIAQFFMDAADACERAAMPGAAKTAYEQAYESSPSEEVKDEARRRHEALGEPTAAQIDRERAVLLDLEKRLADFPRSCPVRRDHSVAK